MLSSLLLSIHHSPPYTQMQFLCRLLNLLRSPSLDELVQPLLTRPRGTVQKFRRTPEEYQFHPFLRAGIDDLPERILELQSRHLIIPNRYQLISAMDRTIRLGHSSLGQVEDENPPEIGVVLLEDDSHGFGEGDGDVVAAVHRINEIYRSFAAHGLRGFIRFGIPSHPSIDGSLPLRIELSHAVGPKGLLHPVEESHVQLGGGRQRSRRGAGRRGDEG